MRTKKVVLSTGEDAELYELQLSWQKLGLTYTLTGYGKRIPTTWMIYYQGKHRRVYATCFSNAASCWVLVNGHPIYLN